MAVIVEAITVIVRNPTIEARFPGGLAEFERLCPNSTFCSDGSISRVGFMVQSDAESFVQSLVGYGFSDPSPDGSGEAAIVVQGEGFLYPCEWLDLDLGLLQDTEGGQVSAAVARLRGEDPHQVAAPPGWSPGRLGRSTGKELEEEYELVEELDGVETYRQRETGEVIYIGRAAVAGTPDWEERYSELADELHQLEHGAAQGPGEYFRRRLDSYERAQQLSDDTESKEAGPALLLCIAARLLEKWETAESAARQVTQLQPELLAGWLELTWALISQKRFVEAESSARHALELCPDRPETLGNLASVQFQRGDLDDAEDTVRRALELDPDNPVNNNILRAIRRGRLPWYRRLLGG